MVSVYDLAGKPDWKPITEIPDHEITPELDKLLEILDKKCILVDTICEVDKKELYRFFTEELFHVETNDIQIPGMMHCFTYEEFYPNHEHDIKNSCTEIVDHLMDKEKKQPF